MFVDCRIFPFSGKVRLSATRLPTWLDLLPGSASSGDDMHPPDSGNSTVEREISSDNKLSVVTNRNAETWMSDKGASNAITENAAKGNGSTNEKTELTALEEQEDNHRKERVF